MLAASLLFFALSPARSFASDLVPGDILVNNLSTSNVQEYQPNGTLVHTFKGTGTLFEGASITPTGDLVTTYRSPSPGGVDVFSSAGTQVLSFTTPQVAGNQADVSVFPDGVFAVNNQNSAGDALDEYSSTGSFIRSITLPDTGDPSGNYVAPNGTLWVVEAAGPIINMDENGATQTTIEPDFSGGVAVVVNPIDNSIYVTDYINSLVHHFSSTGAVLGQFSTNISDPDGIGIASDGTLYIDGDSDLVDHYSDSGTLLGTITLSNPGTPLYLSVIPIPEPTSLALATITFFTLLARPRLKRGHRQCHSAL
jgi:sugar lactone lactonase YvrE